MTSHILFRDTSFPPDVVAILRDAFARACRSLQEREQPSLVYDVIAERLIKLAKDGERDPRKLCEEALSALGLHSNCD